MPRYRLGLTLAVLLVFTLGLNRPVLAQGFVSLVKGDDPAQFLLVGLKPDSLAIHDGEVRLSGTPDGYFTTREIYKNYVLRFEWRYERPADLASDAAFRGNSGLLIHIDGPPKVWPRCIESQLMNADAGNLFAVGGASLRGLKDAKDRRRAIKAVGEWNAQEVTCRNGVIISRINGVEVARGVGAIPDRGAIGWQSEGTPIRFRKLEIQVIPSE